MAAARVGSPALNWKVDPDTGKPWTKKVLAEVLKKAKKALPPGAKNQLHTDQNEKLDDMLDEYYHHVWTPLNPALARRILRSPAKGPRGQQRALAMLQSEAAASVQKVAAAAAIVAVGRPLQRSNKTVGRPPRAPVAAADAEDERAPSSSAAASAVAAEAESPQRNVGQHGLRAKPRRTALAEAADEEAAEAAAHVRSQTPGTRPRTRNSPGRGSATVPSPASKRKGKVPEYAVGVFLDVLVADGVLDNKPKFHWNRIRSLPANGGAMSAAYYSCLAGHINKVISKMEEGGTLERQEKYAFDEYNAKELYQYLKSDSKKRLAPGATTGAEARAELEDRIFEVFKEDHSVKCVTHKEYGLNLSDSEAEDGGGRSGAFAGRDHPATQQESALSPTDDRPVSPFPFAEFDEEDENEDDADGFAEASVNMHGIVPYRASRTAAAAAAAAVAAFGVGATAGAPPADLVGRKRGRDGQHYETIEGKGSIAEAQRCAAANRSRTRRAEDAARAASIADSSSQVNESGALGQSKQRVTEKGAQEAFFADGAATRAAMLTLIKSQEEAKIKAASEREVKEAAKEAAKQANVKNFQRIQQGFLDVFNRGGIAGGASSGSPLIVDLQENVRGLQEQARALTAAQEAGSAAQEALQKQTGENSQMLARILGLMEAQAGAGKGAGAEK